MVDVLGPNETFRPVIFIGLGSTGTKIVSKIRKSINERADENSGWFSRFYHYLGIMSETSPEDGVDTTMDLIHLASNGLSAKAAIENVLKSHNKKVSESARLWWHSSSGQPYMPAIPTLDEGVGGKRSIGRMLLHSSHLGGLNLMERFEAIKVELKNRRDDLPDHLRPFVDDRVDCYLIGLLAGGTCSGIFPDTALMLKSALGIQTNVMATFLLGDICYGLSVNNDDPIKSDVQRLSTLYALAEAYFMHTPGAFKVMRNTWSPMIGSVELESDAFEQVPFHSITLIGAKNQKNAQLSTFTDYQDFVAEYFSTFFTSNAARQRMGRFVDEIAKMVNVEEQNPNRSHRFARLGRLHVSVPVLKITRVLENQLAMAVYESSISAPEEEVRKEIERLSIDTHWGAFESNHQVDSRGDDEFETWELQQDAEEFADQYQSQRRKLDAKYGALCPSPPRYLNAVTGALDGSPDFTGQVVQEWQKALDALLNRRMGHQADTHSSLGVANQVLLQFKHEIDNKLRKAEEEATQAEATLYTSGETKKSLSKNFDDALQEAKAEFPEASLLKVWRYWQRDSFQGDDNVRGALKLYAEVLRRYVNSKRMVASLQGISREIMFRLLVLELLNKHVVGKVATDCAREQKKAFDEDRDRGIRIEIINRREDIEKSYVTPLMEQQRSNADGKRQKRKNIACESLLSKWAGRNDDPAGLAAKWPVLLTHVRGELAGEPSDQPIASADTLFRNNEDLRNDLRLLQKSLKVEFDNEIRTEFSDEIENLSVWDLICRHVSRIVSESAHQQNPMNAETILVNIFKSWFEILGLYPKLNDGNTKDISKFGHRNVFICKTEDAKRCFEMLELENPDTYLSGLLLKVFGFAPILEDTVDVSPQELLVFMHKQGELPVYIEGYEEIADLLQDPPQERRGNSTNWTDHRFPEWISKWRKICLDGDLSYLE